MILIWLINNKIKIIIFIISKKLGYLSGWKNEGCNKRFKSKIIERSN